MAAFSGTAGSVTVGAGAQLMIGNISEWSLDASMSPVESTVFGETWDSAIPSVRNVTVSFSGNLDRADSGQDLLDTQFETPSSTTLRLWETADKYWLCVGFITGISPTISVKGKGEMSYNFQGSGSVTYV